MKQTNIYEVHINGEVLLKNRTKEDRLLKLETDSQFSLGNRRVNKRSLADN